MNVDNFADERRYHIPETVKDKPRFHNIMVNIQNAYQEMTDTDSEEEHPYVESVEDARGILPLNIYSPVTMSCSYRSLLGLLRQRMCVAAQEEWREVIKQMREEIRKHMGEIFAEPFDSMCKRHKNGKCHCKTLGVNVDKGGISK